MGRCVENDFPWFLVKGTSSQKQEYWVVFFLVAQVFIGVSIFTFEVICTTCVFATLLVHFFLDEYE